MPDQYDRQIAEIMEGNPNEMQLRNRISSVWSSAEGIFRFVVPPDQDKNNNTRRPDNLRCGCLTMIQQKDPASSYRSRWVAWTDELTSFIRSDPRIPDNEDEIKTQEDLEYLASTWRKINAMMGW